MEKEKPVDPAQSGERLPAGVVKLGWVSFFTDVASEMLYPVVPLFLTAALGAPVAVLGAIEGVAEAIVSLMKGVSGWGSDRVGRRLPFIRLGYGLGAISKPLMALAFSWPMIFFARCLDRFGKGLRTTARDALIADAAGPGQAGRAYGFHRAMDTAGAMLGVLLAMGLLAILPGAYRTIFLLAGLPGLAAVWLTFRLTETAANARPDAPRDSRDNPLPAPPAPAKLAKPWSGLSREYWRMLVLLTVFAFANSSDALLILKAKDVGLTDVQAILAYLLFNLVYAVSAYPLGALSDRCGRIKMLLGGWTLYAGIYFGFAGAGAGALWWLFPLYGLFMGATDGVGRALIRDHIPADRKGTAMGLFHMSAGLSSLAGSVTAGLCWDNIAPGAAFVLGGGAALAGVILAVFLLAGCAGEKAPGDCS